jgi:hypothetical protein
MGVATTLCWVPVFLGLSVDVAAEQPPLPNAPNACSSIPPGYSLIEARILSFEQPRYTCDPYNSTTQGWTEELVGRDPKHVPLQPTAKKGCILTDAHMVVLDDRALDNLPDYDRTPAQIELRVDGASRTVPYANMWGVCDLAPGHHVVEMATDRGPLTCEGEVRAHETLTLAARSYRAILRIEPTRLVGGVQRLGHQLTVEYDEFSLSPQAYRPHYDGFPASAILRVWTSDDGVLHAEPCPHHLDAPAKSAPPTPPRASRAAPPGGCAHCEANSDAPSPTMFAVFVVLAIVLVRRRT